MGQAFAVDGHMGGEIFKYRIKVNFHFFEANASKLFCLFAVDGVPYDLW